jgi:hypothetical protein
MEVDVNSVADFLRRAAERNGFHRDRYEEKRIPTDFTNVCILPFFGDLRSMTILSSYILHRYREESRGSKYFIVASWPGFQGLFPYVDEYWSLTDESIIKRFYDHSEGMRNSSDLNVSYMRNMNEFFRDVIDAVEIQKYYRNGFTNYFFDKFQDTKRFLPFIPSSSIIGKDFNRNLMTKPGYKVFLHPSVYCRFWHNGISDHMKVKKEFYIDLVNFLFGKDVTCVLWHNAFSYDLADSLEEKCVFLREQDVTKALSAMRACGCVLDTFNGLSRLSLLARTPFLSLDERSRFSGTKEFEIDHLSGNQIPYQYIFSFSTIITDGDAGLWKSDIFPSIYRKLDEFLPNLNRDEWPSTAENIENLPYEDFVQPQKKKKLGTRFIKVAKE